MEPGGQPAEGAPSGPGGRRLARAGSSGKLSSRRTTDLDAVLAGEPEEIFRGFSRSNSASTMTPPPLPAATADSATSPATAASTAAAAAGFRRVETDGNDGNGLLGGEAYLEVRGLAASPPPITVSQSGAEDGDASLAQLGPGRRLSFRASVSAASMGLNTGRLTGPLLRSPVPGGEPGASLSPEHRMVNALVAELAIAADDKLESVLRHWSTPIDDLLTNGHSHFDQILRGLHAACAHDASFAVEKLITWRSEALESAGQSAPTTSHSLDDTFTSDPDHYSGEEIERREISLQYLFDRACAEIFQPGVPPFSKELCTTVSDLFFQQFSLVAQFSANKQSVDDLMGVAGLALGRLSNMNFHQIARRFLKEAKQDDGSDRTHVIQHMRHMAVRLYPMEALQRSFNFLQECADLFVGCRKVDKLKHAWGQLFADLLTPLAATAKSEVNVPTFRGFVETLTPVVVEATRKPRHAKLVPLLAVLLSVSQKEPFLARLPQALSLCLPCLSRKGADQQAVFCSIYRLVWVYLVKFRGESNSATEARLRSVLDILLPHHSRSIVPKEGPLNIFVRILLVVAQHNLKFVMDKYVLDLLGAHSATKALAVERITIGIRAFLVIANSREQKEGPPPLPTTADESGMGKHLRLKTPPVLITKAVAKAIGFSAYLQPAQEALGSVLLQLDLQVGRPFLLTNVDKPAEEALGRESKRLVELLCTCLVAVPRITPSGITPTELYALLARTTIHVDAKARRLAQTSLQALLSGRPDSRPAIVHAYVTFVCRDVPDTDSEALNACLRLLVQLLKQWQGFDDNPERAPGPTPTAAGLADARSPERPSSNFLQPPGGSSPQDGLGSPREDSLEEVERDPSPSWRRSESSPTNASSSKRSPGLKRKSMKRGSVDSHSRLERRNKLQRHIREDLVAENPARPAADASGLCKLLNRIEALGIVMLCGSEEATRLLALTLLAAQRSLAATLQHHQPRFLDVVEREEASVVQALVDSPHYSLPVPPDAGWGSSATQGQQAPDPAAADTWSRLTVDQSSLLRGGSGSGGLFPLSSSSLSPEPLSLRGIAHGTGSGADQGANKGDGDDQDAAASAKPKAPQRDLWTASVCGLVTKAVDRCPAALRMAWPVCSRLLFESPVLSLESSLISKTSKPRRPADAAAVQRFRTCLSLACALAGAAGDPGPAATAAASTQQQQQQQQHLQQQQQQQQQQAERWARQGSGDSGTHAFSRPEFFEFIVPLLQSEAAEIRGAVEQALEHTEASIYPLVSEELESLTQEAMDLRSESARKRKRRDLLRATVARAHSHTARAAAQHYSGATEFSKEHDRILRYIVGTRSYLEMASHDLETLRELCLHFARYVGRLIRHIEGEPAHRRLFSDELRTDLYSLFARWTCPFSSIEAEAAEAVDEELALAALDAVAALCRGPAFDAELSVTGATPYLYELLSSVIQCATAPAQTLAIEAVENLVLGNEATPVVLSWAVDLCFASPQPLVRQNMFRAVARVLTLRRDFPFSMVKALCLSLFMTADPDEATRSHARHLLNTLRERYFGPAGTASAPFMAVPSCVPSSYRQDQSSLAMTLAELHPRLALAVFLELCLRFEDAPPDAQRLIVFCLVPWLTKIELRDPRGADHPSHGDGLDRAQQSPGASASAAAPECHAHHVLTNLFYVSLLTASRFDLSCGSMWGALCKGGPANIQVILDFLVEQGNLRENTDFVLHAKRIVVDLARTNTRVTIEALLAALRKTEPVVPPSSATASSRSSAEVWHQTEAIGYVAPLNGLIPYLEHRSPDMQFSCVLILLVEVVADHRRSYAWAQSLPHMLQALFLGLDQPNPCVHEHAKQLLVNLMYALDVAPGGASAAAATTAAAATSRLAPSEAGARGRAGAASEPQAEGAPARELIALLTDEEAAELFPHEDITAARWHIDSEAKVASLCERVLAAFAPAVPDLRARWVAEALRWATSSTVRHFASRAFQVFRALQPVVSEAMLGDMVTRLAEAAANSGTELQGYVIDILLTFEVIARPGQGGGPAQATGLLPRIFWTSVALLESDFVHEFQMAVRLITTVMTNPGFDEAACQANVKRLFEELEWQPEFSGVHSLSLKGLTSAPLVEDTLCLLSQLTPTLDSPIIDGRGPGALALNIMALTPHIVSRFSEPDALATDIALRIAQAVKGIGPGGIMLEKLFRLYGTNLYPKTVDLWVADVCKYYAACFFPAHDLQVAALLLAVLEHGDETYKGAIASILAALMRHMDLTDSVDLYAGELVSVVVQLLREHLWDEAVRLVDSTASAGRASAAAADGGSPRARLASEDLDAAGQTAHPFWGANLFKANWQQPLSSQTRARERLSRVLRICGNEQSLGLAPLIAFSSDNLADPEDGGSGNGNGSSLAPPVSVDGTVVVGSPRGGQRNMLPLRPKREADVMQEFDFLYDDEYGDGPGEKVGGGEAGAKAGFEAASTTTEHMGSPPPPNRLTAMSSLSGSDPSLSPGKRPTRPRGGSEPPPLFDKVMHALKPTLSQHSRTSSQRSLESSFEERIIWSHFDYCPPKQILPRWRAHVARLLQDTEGTVAVQTYQFFVQLLEALRQEHTDLCRASSELAAADPAQSAPAAQLPAFVTLLAAADVPFVYVDTVVINTANLLDKHKILVLELDQILDGYLHRRGLCKTLLAEATQQPSRGSEQEGPRLPEAIAKLNLQMAMLVAAGSALLDLLRSVQKVPGVHDMSRELSARHEEIRQTVAAPEALSAIRRMDFSTLLQSQAIAYLDENLKLRHTKKAVSLLHAFRNHWPESVFGGSEDDDAHVLTQIYARSAIKNRVCSVAVTAPDRDLGDLCQEMREVALATLCALQARSGSAPPL